MQPKCICIKTWLELLSKFSATLLPRLLLKYFASSYKPLYVDPLKSWEHIPQAETSLPLGIDEKLLDFSTKECKTWNGHLAELLTAVLYVTKLCALCQETAVTSPLFVQCDVLHSVRHFDEHFSRSPQNFPGIWCKVDFCAQVNIQCNSGKCCASIEPTNLGRLTCFHCKFWPRLTPIFLTDILQSTTNNINREVPDHLTSLIIHQ